jgi:hypothetical protein
MPIKKDTDIKHYQNAQEIAERGSLMRLLRNTPIPEEQILENLGLFLDSKNLSRVLFMNHLYKKLVEVPGIIMEFGTRWGQNGALLSALRGIYEPFHRHRKIVLFDTFTGFPALTDEDGKSDLMRIGQLKTSDNYEEYLGQILTAHERLNPLSHITKFEICKGDATESLPKYFEKHPETIIGFAYFDFDVYAPTKHCLELIKPRLVKGSVVGFDELNDPDSPGETLALMAALGLPNVRLRRYRYTSRASYFIVE